MPDRPLPRVAMPKSRCSGITERLDWRTDGAHWPLREASRFVEAGGIRWHVQKLGQGPVMLLLHGTGASTHSFRDLAPMLSRHFTIVSPDLPGHAFTETPPASQLSLRGMAGLVEALVVKMGLDVAWIVGHSAGAAIGAQMIGNGWLRPRGLVGLNAAMLPLGGVSGLLFPPVARLFSFTSLVPRLFAWQAAQPGRVERLIDGTGSRLDPEGLAFYACLSRDVKHVSAALGMMARWDMSSVSRIARRLATPLLLLVGENDRAVPPSCAEQLVATLPASTSSTIELLPDLGHLAHEERPEDAARLIEDWVRSVESAEWPGLADGSQGDGGEPSAASRA